MSNNIDQDLLKLKSSLDPMLEATSKNYRKVGNERMIAPLLLFYPLKQVVSIITLGRRGMDFNKFQAAALPLLVGTPYLTKIEQVKHWIGNYAWWQLLLTGLGAWYLLTVIYTFLQMPNWKNEFLFHIDAFRRFRPNEYKIVDPFLDKNFSIESINNWMMRNSNERAIMEITKNSNITINKLESKLNEYETLIMGCGVNPCGLYISLSFFCIG